MKKESKGKAESLKGGDKDERTKTSLHLSVAKYLDQNGFSKTLKKFLKEAQIQKDNLDDVSISLEQIFTKYLAASNCAVEDLGNQKPQVEGDCKKNKKSTSENENHVVAKQSEASSELAGSKKSKEVVNGTVPSSDVKSKEKKRRKKNLDSAENAVGSVKASVNVKSEDILDGAGMKSAQKTENKSGSESVEGTTNKENKKSKKRKGSALEENDSKSRKTVESKQKETEEVEITEGGDDHSGKQFNGGDVQAGLDASIQTPSKDLTSQENGNSGKEEQKSTSQKSSKKQHGNSSEPKTVNAFCRVKIDEVTFADERLQDNSYWAKDGADSGYGAKAQEVLGQVKGRDFRHEKTKKKRGSYRGGHIDLQSHSIKFNYSDADE